MENLQNRFLNCTYNETILTRVPLPKEIQNYDEEIKFNNAVQQITKDSKGVQEIGQNRFWYKTEDNIEILLLPKNENSSEYFCYEKEELMLLRKNVNFKNKNLFTNKGYSDEDLNAIKIFLGENIDVVSYAESFDFNLNGIGSHLKIYPLYRISGEVYNKFYIEMSPRDDHDSIQKSYIVDNLYNLGDDFYDTNVTRYRFLNPRDEINLDWDVYPKELSDNIGFDIEKRYFILLGDDNGIILKSPTDKPLLPGKILSTKISMTVHIDHQPVYIDYVQINEKRVYQPVLDEFSDNQNVEVLYTYQGSPVCLYNTRTKQFGKLNTNRQSINHHRKYELHSALFDIKDRLCLIPTVPYAYLEMCICITTH